MNEIWLGESYDESLYFNQKFNNQSPTKTSITQRLWTDLGRSVGVTTAIQLVWLNRFTGTNPPTNHNSRVIKRTIIYKWINKKPLKTVWPDCKAATKFEKIDWDQA